MTYLILANLSLILFFGIYVLVLKRLTFFQWNRVYLLSAVVISFTMPLLQYVDLSQHKEVYQPLMVMDFAEARSTVLAEVAVYDNAWSLMDWMRLMYGVGAGLMLLWLAIRIYRVSSVLSADTAGKESFSFFNRAFIAEGAERTDIISTHEQIHVKQGHSYDILLLECVRAFNWFNPVFYFYLKELKFQHECIADNVCASDRIQYAELLVANAMDASPTILVHEFSNQSFLKRRIMMLFKNKSKKINRIKYFMVLPVLFIVSSVALAFNNSIKAVVDKQVDRLESLDVALSSSQNKRFRPEPELGWKAFMEWFVANYNVPGAINPADKDPFLAVQFDVSKTGELSNFEWSEGTQFSQSFFDEAIKLIARSKWKPAEKDGEPVDGSGWVGFKFDKSGQIIEDHTRVDVYPEPKGGLDAWRQYIGKWYKFPQELAKQKGSGEVLVSFVIGKSGEIKDMKTLKEPIAGAGERVHEAIAAFGAWKPGILDGEGAEYRYELPVELNAPDGYGVIVVGKLTGGRIKE